MTDKNASVAAPRFRAGLVQMTTGPDVAKNLEMATRLIREAYWKGVERRVN